MADSSGARCAPQLARLPAELFFQIVDYLPAHAGMALALTCHSNYTSIGSRFSATLSINDFDERLEFLRLLRRDFPYYKICQACRSLHIAFSQHKIKIPAGRWNLPVWPEWHPCRALVHVLEPLTTAVRSSERFPGRRPLYFLTKQHARLIERPIQRCLGSLTCFGEILFPEDGSPLAGVRYHFKFEPSIVGRDILWRAWHFVELTDHDCWYVDSYDDMERARSVFAHLDIRACYSCRPFRRYGREAMDPNIASLLGLGWSNEKQCSCQNQRRVNAIAHSSRRFEIEVHHTFPRPSYDPQIEPDLDAPPSFISILGSVISGVFFICVCPIVAPEAFVAEIVFILVIVAILLFRIASKLPLLTFLLIFLIAICKM